MKLEEFKCWELQNDIKITLKNGKIIYCNTEYYIDDIPPFLGITRNEKTQYYKVNTNYDELTVNEVKSIEKA